MGTLGRANLFAGWQPCQFWQFAMFTRINTVTSSILTPRHVLVALVFYLFAWQASPAWATCGDYLHSHHSNSVAKLHVASPLPSHSPVCNGPHCQRDHGATPVPERAIV